MKSQRKSDGKCAKVGKLLVSGLLVLCGVLLTLLWPNAFDRILFKVSDMINLREIRCVTRERKT